MAPVDLDGVEHALATPDVRLIPDQNGAFSRENRSAAAQLEPVLRSFLEAGGVVVVLDGTFSTVDSEMPSETYTVLDPSLLAIDDAERTDGCANVPCNLRDPLLSDTSGPICAYTHTVEYFTQEPWITLSHRQEELDGAVALHRWFNAGTNGPIGIRTRKASPGASVFYQDETGAAVAQCSTLSNGTAVHHMGRNGFLSVADPSTNDLLTITGVQPLDLVEAPLPAVQGVVATIATVNLPVFPGASVYRVMAGCSSQLSETGASISVGVSAACLNTDGSYNVIGEALDGNGELLAYTLQNGVTPSSDSTVTMPAWKAPNLHPNLSPGSLTDVNRVSLAVSLASSGVDYAESVGSIDRAGGSGTFSFYSDSGPGAPAFDMLTHEEAAVFNTNSSALRASSSRTVRGPLITSLDVTLSEVLLPRLDDATIDFTSEGPVVSWISSGALTSVDGGIVGLWWIASDGASHRWSIVFPPGSSVAAPPSPGGSLASMFWPLDDVRSDVVIAGLRLDEASFLPSYDAYRQRPLDAVTHVPSTAFSLRSTSLTVDFAEMQ
jgi:hypothetical protein